MKYSNLNDNELVYLCHENNEEASIVLVDKYKHCILATLKELLKKYNVIGMEVADLYQEGLIGLMNAISSYNENKDTSFYTYANKCIKSNLISAMRQTFRMKNRILNNSCSLDKLIEDSNSSMYDLFRDEGSNPDKLIEERDEKEELLYNIREKLSKNEKIIFELKLKGLSNNEIATLISKNKKYVENAMFRINKKYNNL